MDHSSTVGGGQSLAELNSKFANFVKQHGTIFQPSVERRTGDVFGDEKVRVAIRSKLMDGSNTDNPIVLAKSFSSLFPFVKASL